jgi:hypothetical protein
MILPLTYGHDQAHRQVPLHRIILPLIPCPSPEARGYSILGN